MKQKRSFLPYLLILIGIILPLFLMQHLMQTTAHKGGVAKKDIPADAVTATASTSAPANKIVAPRRNLFFPSA